MTCSLRRTICFLLVAFASVCFFRAFPANATASRLERIADRIESPVTIPIEQLRVGDRVLAKNPEISAAERMSWAEPDWSTWRKLSVEMAKGDGTTLHVEIIRPVEWLESQVRLVVAERAEPMCHSGPESSFAKVTGERNVSLSPNRDAPSISQVNIDAASNQEKRSRPDGRQLPELRLRPHYSIVGLTVELDLAEMGAIGTGIVTNVTDCPEVKPGEGQVITATFRHPPSTDVLDVTFVDESTWKAEARTQNTEPDSSVNTVGVTDNHPFWSVDRQEFVPIGEMEIGERVQTYHGETKRIASKLPKRGPPKEVFNLEVYGEHVYFVGDGALLAHNSYTGEYRDLGDGIQRRTYSVELATGETRLIEIDFDTNKNIADFSPYYYNGKKGSSYKVIEPQMTRGQDFQLANERVGFLGASGKATQNSTPAGFTWHHVKYDAEGMHMVLVPTDIHKAVSHSGGVSQFKAANRDAPNYKE